MIYNVLSCVSLNKIQFEIKFCKKCKNKSVVKPVQDIITIGNTEINCIDTAMFKQTRWENLG